MSNLPVSSSPKAKKLPYSFLTLTVFLSGIAAAFGGWAVIAMAEAYKLKGVAIAADAVMVGALFVMMTTFFFTADEGGSTVGNSVFAAMMLILAVPSAWFLGAIELVSVKGAFNWANGKAVAATVAISEAMVASPSLAAAVLRFPAKVVFAIAVLATVGMGTGVGVTVISLPFTNFEIENAKQFGELLLFASKAGFSCISILFGYFVIVRSKQARNKSGSRTVITAPLWVAMFLLVFLSRALPGIMALVAPILEIAIAAYVAAKAFDENFAQKRGFCKYFTIGIFFLATALGISLGIGFTLRFLNPF